MFEAVLLGVIAGVITSAVIYMAYITISALVNYIKKRLKERKVEEAVSLSFIKVDGLLGEEVKRKVAAANEISLEDLEQGITQKFGSKGMLSAEVDEQNQIIPGTVEMIKSDNRDEKIESLLRENDGVLKIAI